jgi:hypothetical protein
MSSKIERKFFALNLRNSGPQPSIFVRSFSAITNCLHRINPIKVASERHPDQAIRDALVKRGYVTGQDVKEPAVKMLNTFLATMAVEVLINQYTDVRRHVPVLVYENNGVMSLCEDKESVQRRNKHCFLCNI